MRHCPERLPSARLVGFYPLIGNGFTLPVFEIPNSNNDFYVAICSVPGDHRGIIVDFEPISADRETIKKIKPFDIEQGSRWIDIFLWRKKIFIGNVYSIYSQIENIVDEVAADVPLTLFDIVSSWDSVNSANIGNNALVYLRKTYGDDAARHWLRQTLTRYGYISIARAFYEKHNIILEEGDVNLEVQQESAESFAIEATLIGEAAQFEVELDPVRHAFARYFIKCFDLSATLDVISASKFPWHTVQRRLNIFAMQLFKNHKLSFSANIVINDISKDAIIRHAAQYFMNYDNANIMRDLKSEVVHIVRTRVGHKGRHDRSSLQDERPGRPFPEAQPRHYTYADDLRSLFHSNGRAVSVLEEVLSGNHSARAVSKKIGLGLENISRLKSEMVDTIINRIITRH